MANLVPLDIEEYLKEKIREEDLDFELREGSVFVDFFIKPLTAVLQPLRNDLENVRILQSLANYQQMSDEELDALIVNIFLPRRSGNLATGVARLFFQAAQAISIEQGTAFLSTTGLRFLADATTTISAASMSVNLDGSLYYMDVPVTAETAGTEYNIARGELIALEVPVTGVIRVTNYSAFQSGLSTETNQEYFNRAQTAVTVRNLVNDRSVVTTLLDKFSFIKYVTPTGFNDPEMQRDLLTVVLPGPPQHTVSLHRGGKADVFVETESAIEASVTVASAPLIIGNNASRGEVSILDIGFRRVSVRSGYFLGIPFAGAEIVFLLPNLKYTLYLELNSTGNAYDLKTITTAVANPYPAVPVGGIGLANLQTDGASVVSLTDIREDMFSFEHPILSIDSIDIVDPVSLQPTGVTLRDGNTAIVAASLAADPGSIPDAKLLASNGDLYLVFKRSAGIYFQRHSSTMAIATAAVLVEPDPGATNIRIGVRLDGVANIFYLSGADIFYLRVSSTGAVLSGPTTLATLADIREFDISVDKLENTHIALTDTTPGQPNITYMRVDFDGVVTQAPVVVWTFASNHTYPAIDVPWNMVDLSNTLSDTATTGETTSVPGELVDSSATFIVDGVAPGMLVRLISGTGLATADRVVKTVATVTATKLSFTVPVGSLATNVAYEVISVAPSRVFVAWEDDWTLERTVRAAEVDLTGTLQYLFTASEPDLNGDELLPEITASKDDNVSIIWIRGGTDPFGLRLDTSVPAVTGTTGDTDGSRSFIDAGATFTVAMEGRYLGINSGTGLDPEDMRLYLIDEFVSPTHVRLQNPVTASTAADINYSIIALETPRKALAPEFFSGNITALEVNSDNAGGIHIGVVDTVDNSGTVYYSKFDSQLRPLMQGIFVKVSESVNNRSSLSLEVDGLRQPHLVWDDFSASRSAVQLAKYQAQEYAIVANLPAASFSMKEDDSIILNPTLEGQSLRINYTYADRVAEVDEYVINTVNRILNGDYCTRAHLPAYVDVTLTYGGVNSPSVEDATTLVTDFINAIGSDGAPPSQEAITTRSTLGDILEASDLVDVLYDNGADTVRLGTSLTVDTAEFDRTTRTLKSEDRVQIPRTSKFQVRTVTLTKE